MANYHNGPRECINGCGMIAKEPAIGKHEKRCFTTPKQLIEYGQSIGNLPKDLKEDECWVWINPASLPITPKTSRPGISGERVYVYMTRLVNKLSKEEYKALKKQICHTCDNGFCVNPKHLYIGTQTDNVRDMTVRHRHGGRFTKGHKLNDIYQPWLIPRKKRNV